MKVSIVGAGSFLATSIIRLLKYEASVTMTLFSREDHKTAQGATLVYNYPAKKLDLEVLERSDVIIFCAAAGVQDGKTKGAGIYELNAHEPIILFNRLVERNYQGIFITFGSYFEIGNNSCQKLFTEAEVVNAMFIKPNDYSVSKSLLSKFLYHKAQQRERIPFRFFHLLLSTIYGPGEAPGRLIPYIINNIAADKAFQLSEGKQVRQYMYVDDVARCITLLLAKEVDSGVYNVTAAEAVSVRSVAEQVIAAAERKFAKKALVSFDLTGKSDLSMEYLALAPSPVMKEMGWEPEILLQEGINKYFEA